MRVPVSWLREYVEFEQPIEEVAHLLTIAGLEVKAIERTGGDWDRVFVGRVERVEPHPNADRLVLATVDYGRGELTVVTGAPNIAEGQKVALALEGAVLDDPYSETPRRRRLKAGKIRGVRSEGMVCSERELGLGGDHEGILVLDPRTPVGAPLAEVLGDVVLEFDLTPNFAYASSIVGIAREVAAITGGRLRLPEVPPLPMADPGVQVRVAPDAALSRYMLQRLDNITVAPAPAYVQERLRACGLRTINNVVDITNYVMLEYGQPLHPFDASRVEGDVVVRPAHPGERLETLDHQVREMPPGTVMIADEEKAIGIGGIMGGLDSEVSESTTSVLLESATFDAPRIRRSSREMGLRTDASARFERGTDPDLAAVALARAVGLLVHEVGARPVGGPSDWYPAPGLPEPVRLDASEIERQLGVKIPAGEAAKILASLGFGTSVEGSTIFAAPPSFRRDVTRPADLVEEVGRIWGYDNIPAELPKGELPAQTADEAALLERTAREWLAGAGLQEVINYDLTSLKVLDAFRGVLSSVEGPALWRPEDELLKVLNPLSTEHEYLRPALLPELLQNLAHNLRHDERVWLFELDRVFVSRGPRTLPDEPKRLGIVLTGPRRPRSPLVREEGTGVLDLKGIVEGLLRELNVSEYDLCPLEAPGDGALNALGLSIGGRCAGFLFELGERPLAAADVSARVAAAEIEWDAVLAHASLVRRFRPFSRFPAVRQDIAVLVPDSTPAESVRRVIEGSGGRYLRHLDLVEIYSGDPLPGGTKSLLYRLGFQADDRTLTEDEASRARRGVERALREQLGARIRGADDQ